MQLFFPNHMQVSIFAPLLNQLPPTPRYTQYSLFRPLRVHARLQGECFYHLKLQLGKVGLFARVGIGTWNTEVTQDIRDGISHKQLVIQDAKTRGKVISQTISQLVHSTLLRTGTCTTTATQHPDSSHIPTVPFSQILWLVPYRLSSEPIIRQLTTLT